MFQTHVLTQQQIKVWRYSNDWQDDDEIIECYKGYKKFSIKEQLMPIAWHPLR